MKRTAVTLTILLVLCSASSALSAEVRSWELDKAHTNFYFTIDHIFSKVRGQFNDYSGEVLFDPENLAASRFSFAIKTASVDTGIAKRDKHLQSADFFDAGAYPLMTFVSEKIIPLGENRYQVAGKFTVKGVAYDLQLPMTLVGIKAHPAVQGQDVIGFNGTLTIDRLAYKVGGGKFFDMGVVGREVEILVSLEALTEK